MKLILLTIALLFLSGCECGNKNNSEIIDTTNEQEFDY